MKGEEGQGRARGARIVRWTLGIVAVLALMLLALWTQRAPIAENFIARELTTMDVRARYDLAEIGVRTQRIENIVLGDPARPDLTARWVEVDIALAGLSPHVAAVRAGGVRLYGSFKGGRLSLGELDKFRDPTSTAPFSLPDIAFALEDARMRLETDYGPVGIRMDGSGNPRARFAGKLAAVMPGAVASGCALTEGTAYLDVSISGGRPRIAGPVRGAALGCPVRDIAVAKPQLGLDVTLSPGLDRWTGRLALAGSGVQAAGSVLARPSGRISFDGSRMATRGQVRIDAQALSAYGVAAERSTIDGAWSVESGAGQKKDGTRARFDGMVSTRTAHLAGRDPLGALRAAMAGTPVAPLALRLADAVKALGEDNRVRAHVSLIQDGVAGHASVKSLALDSRSGARVALGNGGRIDMGWPNGRLALSGGITMGGGGLPHGALRLAQRPGGGLSGQLFLDPYAAGSARLAASQVLFRAMPDGGTRFATRLSLDGPLPGGALRGLSLPLEGVLGRDGGIAINRGCTPLSLASLDYGGFALGRTALTLCPASGQAMLAYGPRGLSGGGAVRNLALQGRMGQSPLRLAAESAAFTLATPGFTLANADLAIGPADAPVHLTAATLEGTADKGGLAGRMTGVGGRIGTVPLIISKGSGDWRFADGALGVRGAITLSDAEQVDRFNPLHSGDFALALRDGRITARGTLTEPGRGAKIMLADIVHDLGSGKGHADLDVPGLTFGPGLQPEDVTHLALGVVANAHGTVTGHGQIRWTGDRVESDGLFSTDKMDLAAAFGPVTGLSGQIRFTDLIGLVTAPGQVVRLASVNPGIEVADGIVRYRLEAGQHVRIEAGEWPFAGGRLLLLPTVMDFSADTERYLTFRVIGLDAGAFINTLELKDISATGTFDGLLPLIFNAQGGRIAGGVLAARQTGQPPLILPEGVLPTVPCDPTVQSGTLSYVGAVSNEQLGAMGRLAFDALKNLQYKCLTILMDGALDGELVSNVVFNGVNRGQIGPLPASLARNFIGLPFIFNIRIQAPFRGLLGTAQSFIDPSGLIRNSLGDQFQEKMREGLAVQPPESETQLSTEQK
ncbi:intermembrane phospholipid transport protein YdbH family protein [Sphingobium aquiterrae]|uniref:intermembrane phospholipid transport protein YdbH family protein n=1 Tax=Sphingobium aquiterrae TaxID=2038656 RepID=UPI003016C6DE